MYKLLIYNENIYLHIIGKNPTEDMFSYQKKYHKNVIITGFINNIDEYISRMDLYISPLFVGTGMKNKILQAMNLGIPLICSRVSAEGIVELQNGINCIICDSLDAKEWIDNIIYLLKNSELMEKFSKETRLIIKKNYTWEKIARDFINKCKFL